MTSVPDTSVPLCLLLILLIPLAFAGMSLMNAGLCRSRSAAHAMVSSLCVLSIATIAYLFLGASLQGYAGEASHSVVLAGKSWNWVGGGNFFLIHLDPAHMQSSLTGTLQIFAVALAALIPLSSGADRWRLGAICLSTSLLAALLYPLFAHWVWSGGWLAQLGTSYGLGRGFVDMSGAGVIHTVAGISCLAVTWVLGPRRSKFLKGGIATAIPGHNMVIALFGCALMLLAGLRSTPPVPSCCTRCPPVPSH